MDYRHMFAFASIVFSAGYFIRSFQHANAYPQGPNISFGNNPLFSDVGKSFSSSSVNTSNPLLSTGNLMTATSDSNIVITGIAYNISTSGSCHSSTSCLKFLEINGQRFGNVFEANWEAKIVLKDGDTLDIGYNVRSSSNYYSCDLTCDYYVQGYYVHP